MASCAKLVTIESFFINKKYKLASRLLLCSTQTFFVVYRAVLLRLIMLLNSMRLLSTVRNIISNRTALRLILEYTMLMFFFCHGTNNMFIFIGKYRFVPMLVRTVPKQNHVTFQS